MTKGICSLILKFERGPSHKLKCSFPHVMDKILVFPVILVLKPYTRCSLIRRQDFGGVIRIR